MAKFLAVLSCVLLIKIVSAERPVGGANCTAATVVTDCGGVGHAVCELDHCICAEEYTDSDCSYQRKSQLTAFLLGFFLGGVSADMFYLEVEGRAIAKIVCWCLGWLILPIMCSVSYCVFSVRTDGDVETANEQRTCPKGCKSGATFCTSLVLMILLMIGTTIWVVVDWALIAANKIADGNGEYPVANM